MDHNRSYAPIISAGPMTTGPTTVDRAESLRSELSDGSQQSQRRVSFRKDVHVKRIPRFRSESVNDLTTQANEIAQQLERVQCSTSTSPNFSAQSRRSRSVSNSTNGNSSSTDDASNAAATRRSGVGGGEAAAKGRPALLSSIRRGFDAAKRWSRNSDENRPVRSSSFKSSEFLPPRGPNYNTLNGASGNRGSSSPAYMRSARRNMTDTAAFGTSPSRTGPRKGLLTTRNGDSSPIRSPDRNGYEASKTKYHLISATDSSEDNNSVPHPSQRPVSKPPLTRGNVHHIAQRLDSSPRRPPRSRSAPTAQQSPQSPPGTISSSKELSHNYNKPFSYLDSNQVPELTISPPKEYDDDYSSYRNERRPNKDNGEIVYAQVVIGNGTTNSSNKSKQTIHRSVPKNDYHYRETWDKQLDSEGNTGGSDSGSGPEAELIPDYRKVGTYFSEQNHTGSTTGRTSYQQRPGGQRSSNFVGISRQSFPTGGVLDLKEQSTQWEDPTIDEYNTIRDDNRRLIRTSNNNRIGGPPIPTSTTLARQQSFGGSSRRGLYQDSQEKQQQKTWLQSTRLVKEVAGRLGGRIRGLLPGKGGPRGQERVAAEGEEDPMTKYTEYRGGQAQRQGQGQPINIYNVDEGLNTTSGVDSKGYNSWQRGSDSPRVAKISPMTKSGNRSTYAAQRESSKERGGSRLNLEREEAGQRAGAGRERIIPIKRNDSSLERPAKTAKSGFAKKAQSFSKSFGSVQNVSSVRAESAQMANGIRRTRLSDEGSETTAGEEKEEKIKRQRQKFLTAFFQQQSRPVKSGSSALPGSGPAKSRVWSAEERSARNDKYHDLASPNVVQGVVSGMKQRDADDYDDYDDEMDRVDRLRLHPLPPSGYNSSTMSRLQDKKVSNGIGSSTMNGRQFMSLDRKPLRRAGTGAQTSIRYFGDSEQEEEVVRKEERQMPAVATMPPSIQKATSIDGRSVFFHTEAIADIPSSPKKGAGSSGSILGTPTSTRRVTRSYSWLAPWGPRHTGRSEMFSDSDTGSQVTLTKKTKSSKPGVKSGKAGYDYKSRLHSASSAESLQSGANYGSTQKLNSGGQKPTKFSSWLKKGQSRQSLAGS